MSRYQQGCLYRESRKAGPDVWVFRYRDGQANRKEIVGTVEQFPSRKAAMKACESLRANINQESRSPRTVGELVTHYTAMELPNKTPYTAEVYAGYLKTWIQPKWEGFSLSDVRTVAVETWLKSVPLADGTKAKLRNLMHALYNHAMRWEFFDRNPITLVRQSAKRTRVPDVLTVEEIGKLLGELADPWRTAVYVAVTTGLRVSELLALKWADMDFAAGEIHLSRGIVRQHIGQMKTEASRKPVPLDAGLADVLLGWRGRCPYNQDADYIFASPDKNGSQPYWPNAAMEDHIRPAAKRAGIQKRLGWHTLRHTYGTLVKSQGADVATTQALMRHANASITMDRYVQAVTPAKREAQSRVVNLIPFPSVPTPLTEIAVTG
ncbi:MAG: tyrosine-type recombinase/integrase [Candidatus Sulfotelmatobacter sp.]